MFIVRINWNEPTFPTYHVYSCSHYIVSHLTGGVVQLCLGAPEHDIRLSDGAEAFIMNEAGKTIDSIRSQRSDPRTGEANMAASA